MDITSIEKNNDFSKIDKITKITVSFICFGLGIFFIASCIYMLNVINKPQNTNTENTNTVQNMNLVRM